MRKRNFLFTPDSTDGGTTPETPTIPETPKTPVSSTSADDALKPVKPSKSRSSKEYETEIAELTDKLGLVSKRESDLQKALDLVSRNPKGKALIDEVSEMLFGDENQQTKG